MRYLMALLMLALAGSLLIAPDVHPVGTMLHLPSPTTLMANLNREVEHLCGQELTPLDR